MRRILSLSACVLACVAFLPIPGRPDGNGGTQATPPPEIYHVVTTALCLRLHERVRPAVAMILQNDQTISKSPALFKRYAHGAFASQDVAANPSGTPAPPNGDSIYNESPETNMALQQMSYLVSPIAQNLIAAQRLLDDDELTKPTGNPADDAKLQQIKDQLLQTVAFQSASLDIINGFVQTQQMGELQHAGEEYIGAITGTDTTTTIAKDTPSPWQDPNTPGLAPNPYSLDLTSVPGLAVGYNPLSRLVDGLEWTRSETTKYEDTAATNITAALAECGK
jgi:hypothetical protein